MIEIKPFDFKNLMKNNLILKIRLWVYSAQFIHIIAIAMMLFSIDFGSQENLKFQVYQSYRYKLITAWFNFLSLAYLPICVYCDWKELKGKSNDSHVQTLNKIRHCCFSSVLLPATLFSDILFWRLYYKDMYLLMPRGLEHIVPHWTQHCMHSVSLVVVLLDLVLVPRKRPESYKSGLIAMTVFLGSYTLLCVYHISREEYIYPVLGMLPRHKQFLLILYVFVEFLLYFTGQWIVVEKLWGQNLKKID